MSLPAFTSTLLVGPTDDPVTVTVRYRWNGRLLSRTGALIYAAPDTIRLRTRTGRWGKTIWFWGTPDSEGQSVRVVARNAGGAETFVVVTTDVETIKWGTLSPIFDETTDTIGYLFSQPGTAPRSERRASVLLTTTDLDGLLRRFTTSDAQVGATWTTDIDAARQHFAEMVKIQGGDPSRIFVEGGRQGEGEWRWCESCGIHHPDPCARGERGSTALGLLFPLAGLSVLIPALTKVAGVLTTLGVF